MFPYMLNDRRTWRNGAAIGDTFFAKAKLLLGFEGADGATSAADESPPQHAMTFIGDAQIDTAQFKFGSSSCLFDGTGDYLSTPNSTDWDLSTANSDQFTIDFQVRPGGGPFSGLGIMGKAGGNGNFGWWWLDELRITKGVARYASDAGFTAPTAAYPRFG
ncbi:MAG: hypothetical protein E5X49_02025 [Mesorhizobium sp.]|uniref:hypothetical protein n=1 Tax=Mesorhizobium sp. TaxID=1871066 RepID=UPI0012268668|nr:hypothetical protein [Mesorhizobium sp.]TIQ46361.1 MAG: hypothetical protein E5X49_02025 [Mesorhizobium sp.]